MNPPEPSKAPEEVSDKALMEAAMQVDDEPAPNKTASLSKLQKQKRKKARQDAKRARRRNRKR